MKSSLVTPLAGLVLTAAALAGCSPDANPADAGAGDTSTSVPGQPDLDAEQEPNPDDARAALDDWLVAVEARDGATACALETAEFTEWTRSQLLSSGVIETDATCEEATEIASGFIKTFGGMGSYESRSSQATALRRPSRSTMRTRPPRRT